MAAHQATPSLGFSRPRILEWVAISFSNAWKWNVKVKSLTRPYGLQPTRLLCPWDLPGKSTGMGCHCLLRKKSLVFPILLYSSTSYLSLLFLGTLHSNGCIFPFLLCLSLLFFSQLFVRPPQIVILLFCSFFPWGWFWSLPPVQCHESLSIVLQVLYQI